MCYKDNSKTCIGIPTYTCVTFYTHEAKVRRALIPVVDLACIPKDRRMTSPGGVRGRIVVCPLIDGMAVTRLIHPSFTPT